MKKIIAKIITSFKTIGIFPTLLKLGKHFFSRLFREKVLTEKILEMDNIEDRFTEIYKNNVWGNFESVSGNGSTLEGTQNLRNKLPELIQQFSIHSVFDAPCGDFNWMSVFLKTTNIKYIGGDIVLPLIEAHQTNFKDTHTNFIHIDLTKDKFPEADLMICRDCLFHLSYQDTKLVLQNFINSNIKYLLTTTYVKSEDFNNRDITTGDFRLTDLFSAPYQFDQKALYRIDDTIPNETPREMCLWSREQILHALENLNNF